MNTKEEYRATDTQLWDVVSHDLFRIGFTDFLNDADYPLIDDFDDAARYETGRLVCAEMVAEGFHAAYNTRAVYVFVMAWRETNPGRTIIPITHIAA